MAKNFSAKSYKEQLKKTGSFHTNKELALYIKQVLQSIATSDINEVIDTCCGAGNLLEVFECAKYGIDIELEYIHEAKCNNINAICANFLTCNNPFNKVFDYLVANYPFLLRDKDLAQNIHTHLTTLHYFNDLPNLSNILDTSFIAKNLEYLSDCGKAAMIVFPGVLYRGNRERDFREWIVKKGCIVSIEAKEGRFFDDTSVNIAIMLIDKAKKDTNITFIKDSKSYTANIDEIAKNDFNLSVNSYIQHEVEKERINIYSLNHNVNSNLIKGIEKQLELNKMIDSMEQTNYHDSLLNMLKAVIKKYSTKNKDMFKRERSLFNLVF